MKRNPPYAKENGDKNGMTLQVRCTIIHSNRITLTVHKFLVSLSDGHSTYSTYRKPPGNGFDRDYPRHTADYASLIRPTRCWANWGNNRVRFEPADVITKNKCKTNRGEFYLHDSVKIYSHGCIERLSRLDAPSPGRAD